MNKSAIEIPTLGQKYYVFDDGKVSVSRRSEVVVTEIIPFSEMPKNDLDAFCIWKADIEQCDWLYAKETDCFVKAKTEEGSEFCFVRTLDGGWFSMGFFGSRLDIDGSLNANLTILEMFKN